jgi:hypothetical protein
MTDIHDDAATPSRHTTETNPDGKRPDRSFLSAAACAISSVYLTTQSAVAAIGTTVVAVVLVLQASRKR